MSGNPDKASIWDDADVYAIPYVRGVKPALPANSAAPFDASWGLVGLLDGDAGFEESRSRDTSDYFAWGGLLIRTSRRNFVLTRKFTALENNPIVRSMVWPGSGPGEKVVPKADARFVLGFETVDGDHVVRAITDNYAGIEEIGTVKDSEGDLTKYEITVKIYPSANGRLFVTQGEDETTPGAPTLVAIATQATKALAVGAYAPLTVTATYSDNSTANVTKDATWATSAPAKVGVDRGYLQGVAAGTSNVTASYNGQNAICAVTVS